MIELKILGYHSAQRYAVKQTVISAQRILRSEHPDLELMVTELKDWQMIEQYTSVLSAPSMVVNEKLVCVGRFPRRDEVVDWLRAALDSKSIVNS